MPFYDELQTVETPNGKYANQMTSGRAVLPRFQGEKPIYDTADEASQQAAQRSQYEYDELRRDPANQWSMPDTPAPPLLDMPGQSMLQPEAIGKKASMHDPDSIINTIQGGLNALRFDNLLKGNFNPQAHQERILTTGPAAAAAARQQNWSPQGLPDPSFASPLVGAEGETPQAPQAQPDPHGKQTSLVAGDAAQGINDMVANLGTSSSGAVMGAAGTEYDKKARPVQLAMSREDQMSHVLNGTMPNANLEAPAVVKGLNRAPSVITPALSGDQYTGKVAPDMNTWNKENQSLKPPVSSDPSARRPGESTEAWMKRMSR